MKVNTKLLFRNEEHENNYYAVLNQMHSSDCYHKSIAYLFALDSTLNDHIQDVFDFNQDCIKRDALQKDWNTSSSRRSLRLAFNLWNGCYFDNDIQDTTSELYSVSEIFCNMEFFEYYIVAVKLRFK